MLAVAHFRRAAAPLIDLATLKIKTFAITISGGSLFRIAISVSPFLLPLMFQVGFGLSAFQSGLLMLGLFAGNLGMKTVTTPMLKRFGFRNILIVNGILTAFLILACAALSPQTPEIRHHLRAVFERAMPVDAIHELEHHRLRGCAQAAAELGHQLFEHDHADVDGHGRGGGGDRACGWRRFSTEMPREPPRLPTFTWRLCLWRFSTALAVIDCFTLEPDAGAMVSGHKPSGYAGDAALKA